MPVSSPQILPPLWIAFALAALILVGCTPDIHVIDDQGAPVEGAAVEPMALSINGPTRRTDAEGYASLPSSLVQEWKWINVYKVGYEEVSSMSLSRNRPMQVTLRRDSGQSAMILEYVSRDGKAVSRFLDIGSKGIESILESRFHLRPSEAIKDPGALDGVLLISQPDDLKFERPVAKTYLLPKAPETANDLLPWNWLIGTFDYRGKPYNGAIKSGAIIR
jgi:hypothetical protein